MSVYFCQNSDNCPQVLNTFFINFVWLFSFSIQQIDCYCHDCEFIKSDHQPNHQNHYLPACAFWTGLNKLELDLFRLCHEIIMRRPIMDHWIIEYISYLCIISYSYYRSTWIFTLTYNNYNFIWSCSSRWRTGWGGGQQYKSIISLWWALFDCLISWVTTIYVQTRSLIFFQGGLDMTWA